MTLPTRPLGTGGPDVSVLSLGSWRTFERIPRQQGVAVMHAARDAGITFLDDARYDDETGTAPIPTGWSEVVFGELFRAAGWPRDETVVANKLWWEFWPEEGALAEVDGSLTRMGLDHLDVLYSAPPPDGLDLAELVGEVAAVIAAGKARWWGLLNWRPALVAETAALVARSDLPRPVAAQLGYSVVRRDAVEGPDAAALDDAGIAVVASYALAGGLLTGKYDADPAAGRAAGSLDDPRSAAALAAGRRLAALAAEAGEDPAVLALAFALRHPRVASVLFGATTSAQVVADVAAVAVADRLGDEVWARLAAAGDRPD
jgi:L-glyceraldehyde 3-phosphate reductase